MIVKIDQTARTLSVDVGYVAAMAQEPVTFEGAPPPDGHYVGLLDESGTVLALSVISGGSAEMNLMTRQAYDFIASAPVGVPQEATLCVGSADSLIATGRINVVRNWLQDIVPPDDMAPSYPTTEALLNILKQVNDAANASGDYYARIKEAKTGAEEAAVEAANAAKEANSHAEASEQSASSAQVSASEAKQSAASAANDAQSASEAAKTASEEASGATASSRASYESAEEARRSAESAKESQGYAEGAASRAEAAATSATGAVGAVESAKTEAVNAARSAADSAASAAESAESARQFCHDSGVNATSAETYKRLTKEYRDEVVEMVKDVEEIAREVSEVEVDVEKAEAAASNAKQAAADSQAYADKAAKSAEAAADSAAEAEQTAQSFAAELEKVVTTDGGKTIGGVIRIKNLKIAVDDDPSHDIFLVPNASGAGLQLQFPEGTTAFIRKKTGVLATTTEVATVKTAVRAGTDSGEQSDIDEPERVDGKIVGKGLLISPAVSSGSSCDTASIVFRFNFDQSFSVPRSDLILAKFGLWDRGFSQIIVRQSGGRGVLLVDENGIESDSVPLKTGLTVFIAVYEKIDQSTTSVRFVCNGNTLYSQRFTGLNGLNLLVGGTASGYSGITFSQDIYRGYAFSDAEVAQITDDKGEIPLSVATSATLLKTRSDIGSLDREVEGIKAELEGKASETYVDNRLATKQDALTAGDGITLDGNVISASVPSVAIDTSMPASPSDDHVPSTQLLKEELAKKLSLTGGTVDGILRLKNPKVAVDDDTSHDIFLVPNANGAGLQVQFPGGATAMIRAKIGTLATVAEVKAKQDALTAGDGITIEGNVISSTAKVAVSPYGGLGIGENGLSIVGQDDGQGNISFGGDLMFKYRQNGKVLGVSLPKIAETSFSLTTTAYVDNLVGDINAALAQI